MIDDEVFMKIDNDYLNTVMQSKRALSVRGDEAGDAKSAGVSSVGADRIEFSIGRDIEHYKKILNELPEIRSPKIDELKPLVAAGEYYVDSSVVARKMLDAAW